MIYAFIALAAFSFVITISFIAISKGALDKLFVSHAALLEAHARALTLLEKLDPTLAGLLASQQIATSLTSTSAVSDSQVSTSVASLSTSLTSTSASATSYASASAAQALPMSMVKPAWLSQLPTMPSNDIFSSWFWFWQPAWNATADQFNAADGSVISPYTNRNGDIVTMSPANPLIPPANWYLPGNGGTNPVVNDNTVNSYGYTVLAYNGSAIAVAKTTSPGGGIDSNGNVTF